jgi:hypothetical protein
MKWNSPSNASVSESEANRAKRPTEQASERAPGRQPGPAYWLIASNEYGRLEVLVTGLADGEATLPVFSHEEEVEVFLGFWEARSGGWQARKSTAKELISVLYGPCAGVERVALDPLPEMLAERTVGLVSLGRERFAELVLSKERPPARRERRSGAPPIRRKGTSL